MDTDAGTLFLALLAIASQLAIVGIVVAVLGAPTALDGLRLQALTLAWIVAVVATIGSLWLSEGAGFVPCRLCWYQRAAMYPLAVILGIAAARRDRAVRVYALPVIAIGATISVWHMLIERFPSLETGTSCDPANPCSFIVVERFGYLTIPTMALTAFALITVLLLLASPDPQGDR